MEILKGPVASCCYACKLNSNCIAYVHTPKDSGTCFLKNVTTPLVYTAGFVSGIIMATNEPITKKQRLIFYEYDDEGNRISESNNENESNNGDSISDTNQAANDVETEAINKAVIIS